ncbi:MAG: hypothetical protein DMG65_12170 [Candidatus Angelobacter sp. Gp1-AA117]|nr:MAG: hypothetical protein DMG65_12170 [Candidatus Angelobacter sp. Gp1-AA117]
MPQRQPSNNDLVLYRRRMGFSRKYVSGLLGHKNTSALSRLEQGQTVATLETALKLAAIYRTPTDFLYSSMYTRIRGEVRSREARLPKAANSLSLTQIS